ncbi:AAA family ATPase [Pseudoalteromonas sp. B129b]
MSKTLTEIAEQLQATDKKVQLIYAFNGSGKTRLSREFKELLASKINEEGGDEVSISEMSRKNILYYNAFTEDLFYWDNDLDGDEHRKLKIHPNAFTKWVLEEQGQGNNIASNFQRLTNSTIEPRFSADFSEVSLVMRGDDQNKPIKISKGEESNLIWSVFYSLLYLIKEERNISEPENRSTNDFDALEYIFIDDPVSSLDENHLIQLAVDLATLIKSSYYPSSGRGLKFIITTHSPTFYNVLHNELGLNKKGKKEGCYLLEKLEDGSHRLDTKYGDSNMSFSYHLHLKQTLEHATKNNLVERHHFTLLRNLYEKTASFLGYSEWGKLLESAPGDKQGYLNRIIQFTSHNTLTGEALPEPTPPEKQMVKLLLDNLIDNYSYWKQEAEDDQ